MGKRCFGRAIFVVFVVGLTFSLFAQTTAKAPPTQAQLQQMVEAGAYRPALQAIAQIMPRVVAGNAPDYDRYTLLMLRGESLVQLKDTATAIIAFEQAMAAADSSQRDEPARAMYVLLKRSLGVTFTPRTGDRTPLDITNLQTRKAAMAALFNDELPVISARVDEAIKAKSLPPLLAVGSSLRDLHALEEMGVGGDKQTVALVGPLADRIHELIDSELSRVTEETNAIKRSASRTIEDGGGSFQMINGVVRWVPGQGVSGLSSENRKVLREFIPYVEQIRGTCEDLAAVARRYERDGQRWTELARRSRDLRELASAVYAYE